MALMRNVFPVLLLVGGLFAAVAATACGGGSSPDEEGNGERITDPARVPSSTPVQNPTLYKIQGNQVTLVGGESSQLTPVAGNTPAANSKSYTVKSGDTCSQIAAEHGVSLDALVRANPTVCDTLAIGDVLRIPAPEATPTPASGGLTANPTVRATATATTGSGSSGGGKTYTVKSGDTCADIAASYGVSIADIIALNGMPPDCPLQVGQVVSIP